MNCQMCEKKATVHLTEISGGIKKELHLCQECAAKQGVAAAKYQESLSTLLAGIETLSPQDRVEDRSCPHCGLTVGDFRSSGRLGCAQEYSVFGRELMPLIENIHKSRHHKGKQPKRAASHIDRDRELARLRSDLKSAIEAEEYEQAVVLRDQINEIGGRVGGLHGSD